MSETLLVLDFGGHSGEQVARIARNNRIYSEVWPGETSAGKLKELSPIGIILGGGRPDVCVYKESAPRCDPKIFDLGVPVLGICYG
ncbi:MAG: GMP synthase (glutamine-hydrolyzing), partial [Firmicutes bacterium]|nr:GMP synthase (glutamine-hydrolyzing) [Bacillota bacterium]